MKYDDILKALSILGINPPVSLRELKEKYRKKVKEVSEEELIEINRAYKILIELIENYPFKMDKNEFLLAFPEERLMERLFWSFKKE